jgi:7-keto-8-aminopelargonate synthetase-like enzyme
MIFPQTVQCLGQQNQKFSFTKAVEATAAAAAAVMKVSDDNIQRQQMLQFTLLAIEAEVP